MGYLLDTCIISSLFRKEAILIEKLKTIPPEEIKISTVTVMEIEYGLELNPAARSRIQPHWVPFKDDIEILFFSESDARYAAQVRSILKKEGRLIGPYDILLAGTAINHGLTLITNNMSEFSRVKNLHIENWIKTH